MAGVSGIELIRDLAVVLVIAGAAAWLCRQAGLSAIVGYLVAGAILGPHTPPFALVSDLERVHTLAQLGLVFLIFSIGLNLSLSRLKRLGLPVVIATLIGALLVIHGGRLLGWALGWGVTASLFLAGMMVSSSSAIISKVLAELNLTHERPGQMALAMTVLEDVVAILMLTLLTSLIQFGGNASPPLVPTLGALGAFVVFIALLSLLVMPKLLARVSRSGPSEIRTLLVCGLLLAMAWLAVKVGYSLALGAFVFGAIVGSTRQRADIERSFEGLDQTFGAVFFVAVGMMVDFRLLAEAWPLALAIAAAALVFRPLACAAGLVAVGNTSRDSIRAGLALTPMGEFGFIIAQLGVENGALPQSAYPAAVGASLLTSLAAPALARRAEAFANRAARAEPPWLTRRLDAYHRWLARMRDRRTASVLWRLTHRRFLQIGVHMLFVSALLLFANPLYARASAWLGDRWAWPVAVPFLFWTLFGVLVLGPLIAIWRNSSALAMIVSEAATPGAGRQSGRRPLLEAVLRGAALALLAAWLLALLPDDWPLPGAAVAVVVLLGLVAAVFWRRFVWFHSLFEIELIEQVRSAVHPAGASAWPAALPRQSADWGLDLDEVTLPGDTDHAGRTLGELGVRTRFGCSVVGIDRQGCGIVNPRADTALYPLDKLLLFGSPEQLAAAARELGSAAAADSAAGGFDELIMDTLMVPPGCPVAGTPLVELDLIRKVGVQIGGIRHGRNRRLAPAGTDRFAEGDELLVLGTEPQLRRFAELLAPPPAPAEPAADAP